MSQDHPAPFVPDNSPSRRRFIVTAAAAASAASLLGARPRQAVAMQRRGEPVKAAARVPLKDGDPIRLGVIGTGGMGTGHAVTHSQFGVDGKAKVQVVALADVNQIRLLDAQRQCAEIQKMEVGCHTDYKELLARDDIHAVVIASPEHWHAQMAIDAIAAGKDVYLEKPMTLDLPDALRLREAVLANPDVMFAVGTQMIMMPKFIEARKVINSGEIGKPVWSQTSYCRNSKEGEWLYYGLDPALKPGENIDWKNWLGHKPQVAWHPEKYARWRRYRDYSTGIVGDLLVHVMTPLVMAIDQGWPTRVSAIGGHYVDTAMENHDQVNLTVQFEKGHTMVIAGSTCNEVGLETLIRGHKANIYLGGRHCEIRPERLYAEEVDERRIDCPDIGNDQDALRLHWLECIRTRTTPISTVDLGAKVMVIVDLATRAMWQGGSWAFDPATMTARRENGPDAEVR